MSLHTDIFFATKVPICIKWQTKPTLTPLAQNMTNRTHIIINQLTLNYRNYVKTVSRQSFD